MANTSSQNLKKADDAQNEASSAYPYSAEREQILLGACLKNNNLFEQIEGFIRPEHFYVRLHQEVFRAIEKVISKGHEAAPHTIIDILRNAVDESEHKELIPYLADMVENASAGERVSNIAELIHNDYIKRELIDIGHDLANEAPVAPDSEQTLEVIHKAEQNLFNLGESGSNDKEIENLRNPLKMVIESAEDAKKHDSHLTGVTTGLMDLDTKLGGFQRSDLIILAARPSMGKTAMCLNLAFNAATAKRSDQIGGSGVGVFSLEMSKEQLAARILASASGVDSGRIHQGKIKDDEFDRIVSVANELSELDLYIDDTPGLSLQALRSRARRMVRRHGVGMVIVDYLQLMHSSSSRYGDFNRVQEVSEISKGLKGLARELNIPVIVLAQLNRAVEQRDNKRPQLSDLRESGSIEQDADIVMFLYREEYYLERELGADKDNNTNLEMAANQDPKMAEKLDRLNQVRGVTELLISKNRKGSVGTVKMHFDPQTTSFRDLEKADYGEVVAL